MNQLATPAPVLNRETWLNALADLMAPRFAEMGYPLPAFRVSVGFPSAGMDGKAVGECWDKRASKDGRFEIFIRPDRDDAMEVASVLGHELIHAAVGLEHGHKGAFATVALALGYPRPLTQALAPPPELRAWLSAMLDQVGPIPHAALTWRSLVGGRGVRRKGGGVVPEPREDGQEGAQDAPASSRPKRQGTRLRKACCTSCGYTVRVTAKWLEIGPPHCPEHGAMAVEGDDGDQEAGGDDAGE
jgi:hypothetical protein